MRSKVIDARLISPSSSQGDVRPTKQGKPRGSVLDAHAEFILEALREKPDTTLKEMAARPAAERGVRVVWTAVWKFVDRSRPDAHGGTRAHAGLRFATA